MALLWTQKQDVGPTGRIFPAMTFDASRERVVLFGGCGGTDGHYARSSASRVYSDGLAPVFGSPSRSIRW